MRHAPLTTLLLLLPSLATAASQCVVQSAELDRSEQPAQQQSNSTQPSVLQRPRPSTASPDLHTITADEISRVPALQRIASRGAQLSDLGTEHGLRSVFARNGQTFQVFYLTPDGQGAVGGVMWDAAGHNITRQKVSQIDGAIPTVTIGAAALSTSQATPEAAPSPPLWSVATTTYGTKGSATAPRLWVFIDPLCSYSVRAMEQLLLRDNQGENARRSG